MAFFISFDINLKSDKLLLVSSLKKSLQTLKKIDPHIHLRRRRSGFVRRGLKEAAEQGIRIIFDMPNLGSESVLRYEDFLKRLTYIKKQNLPVEWFQWICLTSDEEQIKEAVKIVKNNPWAIGLKLFAGPTTGDLEVIDPKEQEKIYRILRRLGYRGVIAVHCEKKERFNPEKWNSKKPWIHGKIRPAIAEIDAARDQIHFVKITGFKGHLHICHISHPDTLEIVYKAKREGMRISGEITPHHGLLSEDKLREKNGLFYKCNPPLRDKAAVEELLKRFIELVKQGADWLWIATDWAPHPRKKKLGPPYASGIADYSLYGKILTKLHEEGLSWAEIERVTFHNIVKVFKDKLNKALGDEMEEIFQ